MAQINKVLTTVAYNDEDMKRLRSIFAPTPVVQCDNDDTESIIRELEVCDVAVLRSDLDARFYENGNLKWIHCDHAGLNKSSVPEVFEKGIILTGAAGRSAPTLAEHCIWFMLNHVYHYREFLAAQQIHQWGLPDQESFRGLFGKSVGIISIGHTGYELAKRCKAFGMTVLGYARHDISDCQFLDQAFSEARGDSIEPIIKESDFIVLCVQLSNMTHHLISDAQFDMMKPNCFLVNMARGSVVDEAALVRAIRNKKIAGAGLDVFEIEPLPKESPLWDMPNVIITPHTTPKVPHREGRCMDILEENVRHYRNDEPMINRIQQGDVWTRRDEIEPYY